MDMVQLRTFLEIARSRHFRKVEAPTMARPVYATHRSAATIRGGLHEALTPLRSPS